MLTSLLILAEKALLNISPSKSSAVSKRAFFASSFVFRMEAQEPFRIPARPLLALSTTIGKNITARFSGRGRQYAILTLRKQGYFIPTVSPLRPEASIALTRYGRLTANPTTKPYGESSIPSEPPPPSGRTSSTASSYA